MISKPHIIFILSTLLMLYSTATAHAATIQLPQTGQSLCYDNTTGAVIACAGTGQDGDTTAGVAWPTPRFTDNSNGTVTDNLTKLIWLKNASCGGYQTWANAVAWSNALASGSCALSDGSKAGQWHLPSRNELESLVDVSRFNPALPAGHPFTNVQVRAYWSSSTYANGTSSAWFVDGGYGSVGYGGKTYTSYVWPVRSGQ